MATSKTAGTQAVRTFANETEKWKYHSRRWQRKARNAEKNHRAVQKLARVFSDRISELEEQLASTQGLLLSQEDFLEQIRATVREEMEAAK